MAVRTGAPSGPARDGATAGLTAVEGAAQLFELIRTVVSRPLRGELPEASKGRSGVPVVCLIGDGEQGALDALDEGIRMFLRDARPRRVPHAFVDMATERPADAAVGAGAADPSAYASVEAVRGVLARLAQELSATRNGRDRRIRFRRFGLVNWLLQQEPFAFEDAGEADLQHDRILLRKLSDREMGRRRVFGWLRNPENELAVPAEVPWWVKLLGLHVLPVIWFRLWRGVGGEYRWLLRQPYLAPRDPGTLMGFADRLTKPHNGEEDREQLRKLMVNAFLEDLRVAYRRRFWRPRGARRTTYCVAFLRGVGDTDCGYMTLRSIIDVRNETGAFDPLVVVTSGTRNAALAAGMYGEWDEHGPARPGPDRYASWKDDFLHAGRERTRTTWYLPLAVTGRTGGEGVPGARRSRDRLDRLRPIEAAPPAWWARRWVSVTVVCLMVAGLAGTAGWGVEERARWTADHCGLSPAEADATTVLTARGGQCVGVAPNGFAFGTEDPSLKAVLRKIAGLNRAAETANRKHGRRPLITLVHLSALLSSAGRSPVDLAYSREALQGAAIAQKRQLDKHGETDPVLRIFPANAGTDMRYGKQVVDILEGMRKDDPTIVGVTGLDQSRQETVDTIRKLTRVGLPMMGTITSADSLTDVSSLYFQVSPQNRREASVAAAYADAHLAGLGIEKKIRTVYSADAADSYSGNLNADIGDAFRKKGFQVERQAYTLPNPAQGSQGHPALRVVGEGSCGYPGLIFFAGRSEHFEQLLEGVNQACRSHPPVILGGDDVARLVADPGRSGRFPALDYDFLDFTLESASCEGESDLYTGMRELFHEECVLVKDSSLDGHASLAFDAVNLFVKAVGRLQDSAPGLPLSPTAVWHGLSGIHGDAALDGESGRIDFGGQVDQQVPLDKLITVQHVEGAARPEQVGLCGRYGDREQDPWCPALRIAPRK